MKFRITSWLLATAVGTATLVGTAFAAPTGSAYRTAIDALQPRHYYPLDEAFGSPAGTVAVDAGFAPLQGGALQNGIYRAIGPVTFNSSATGQARFPNVGMPTIGATIGPARGMNQNIGASYDPDYILDDNNNHEVEFYNDQLPGFNPYMVHPQDPTFNAATAGVNRAFETNQQGYLELGSNAEFSGDPVTGAFTFAHWHRSSNREGTINGAEVFPRNFSSGGDNGANGPYTQITMQRTFNGFITDASAVGAGHGDAGAGIGVGYSSGNLPNNSPANEGGYAGQWIFTVWSTHGTTPAERAANVQLWERYNLANHKLVATTNNNTLGNTGIALVGQRNSTALSTGLAFQDKLDEVAFWNRVLTYDEMESLYVAAVTPTVLGVPNPTIKTTTGNGNWIGGSGLPGQHGSNNDEYWAVVIDHDVLATEFTNPTTETASFRYNLYRMTVNSGKTLTLDEAATLRSYEDMTINGNLALNGAVGVIQDSNPNAIDFNVSKEASLNVGRHVNIGATANVTMASVNNNIIAEENVTIDGNADFTLTSLAGVPSSGAHLYTVMQADFDAGSGSMISGAGTFTGKFGTHTLPADDGIGRRASVLYEGRASDGSGTLDSMKIGVAKPGDANFDGNVDSTDFGVVFGGWNSNAQFNWRGGDFNADNAVDSTDFGSVFGNFGGPYAGDITPDAQTADLIYDPATGNVQLDASEAAGGVIINFSLRNVAGGADFNAPGVVTFPTVHPFTNDTPTLIGWTDLNAVGFSGVWNLGNIFPAGLDLAGLESFLTEANYVGLQGSGVQVLDLNVVPEPSSALLLALGLVGVAARRRRKAA